MISDSSIVEIHNRDYWFKFVRMLKQNWAFIEELSAGNQLVYFLGDNSGVFDELDFPNQVTAEQALQGNGFAHFDEDIEAQQFVSYPAPPFFHHHHPSDPICSSGRYWR